MRNSVSGFITILILSCLFTSAMADDFTATETGDWKDPATWGFGGYARDLNIPGILDGRLDSVTIPQGITVFYEGGLSTDDKTLTPKPFGFSDWDKADKTGYTRLTIIKVWGEVKGRSSSKPIKLKGTEIEVEPTGKVGGSPSSNSRGPVHIHGDTKVTVKGNINGHGGKVTITSGGNILIAGQTPGKRVQSEKKTVKIVSTGGDVSIAVGDTVQAKRSVIIKCGPNQNVAVNGVVHSEKKNVVVNGNGGNVNIGQGGRLEAPKGEVKIKADTLRVAGKIKGRTVQKMCNVVIIEEGGSIEGKVSNKNKVVVNHNVPQRANPALPAEKADDVRVIGDDDAFIDFSFAQGTVIEAVDFVRVAGGIFSTIDLTGNPAGTPVIVCPGEIEIFADFILLDPGVNLEDLCGPGPVFSGWPQPFFEPACLSYGDTTGYPEFSGEVQFEVANMGNFADIFEFDWVDSLDWGPPPGLTPVLLGGAFDPSETLLTIPFDVPEWAIPDVDTNSLKLTVRSTTTFTEEYTENILIPVEDIEVVKDVGVAVWGVNSAPGGSVMSIEHWISNSGSLPDDYFLTVTNLEGWPVLPFTPDLFLPAEEDILFLSELDVPPGTTDGFPNEVYITAQSMTSPSVSFTDTVAFTVGSISAVDPELPLADTIRHRCYPNPFNPTVTISFTAPNPDTEVSVVVYDVNGRRIKTLLEGIMDGTAGELSWNGTDKTGRSVASGVYFYLITAGDQVATGKMILAK